jgi:hypothetical protein
MTGFDKTSIGDEQRAPKSQLLRKAADSRERPVTKYDPGS